MNLSSKPNRTRQSRGTEIAAAESSAYNRGLWEIEKFKQEKIEDNMKKNNHEGDGCPKKNNHDGDENPKKNNDSDGNPKKNNHEGDKNPEKNSHDCDENLKKIRSKMWMTGSSSSGVFYFGKYSSSVLPELPKDILEEVIHRAGTYINYVRLRAVCKSLRHMLSERPCSEADDHHQRLLPRQLPWLVLKSYFVDEQGQLCHGFFSFSEKKIHRLSGYSVNNSSSTSNGYEKQEYLAGSSHGWLVTVEKKNLSVSLLNPITKNRIRLPPLTTFPNYISSHYNPNKPRLVFHQVQGLNSSPSSVGMCCRFLTKVILIPTGIKEKQFMIIAMLLTKYQLALFKSEDQDEGGKWVLIDLEPHGVGPIQDVVHFNEQIYIVDYNRIYAYDIGSGGVRIIIPKMPQSSIYQGSRLIYLVEMCGELLLVIRGIISFGNMNITRDHKTVGFEVFKVDESKGDFAEVKSLGDRALFVGGRTGSSFTFSGHATDDDGFITRNCIYFTMHRNCLNYGTVSSDIGVFNLEDGSIGPIPFLHTDDNILPLPIWVIPDPGI